MNGRGAEGEGVRKAPESLDREREGGGERRAGAGQRVRVEALVAVGETSGGGFEAESIDMSPEGMRLRTAYLPRVGDALICRFDGLGKELVVEGEVCWRAEQARGGEFGLRFTGLDAEAEEAVRAMCSSIDAGAAGAAPALTVQAAAASLGAAQRGSRVRLHIEGLGSPMKARVRGGGLDDLEVGSNLEFLKVGRSLELEEVDQGTRREAYIDHVKVEVDPATSVPQLVVTLCYEAPRAARAPRPRPSSPEALPPAPARSSHDAGAAARAPSSPPQGERAASRPSSAPTVPARDHQSERAAARPSTAPTVPARDPQGERALARPSSAPAAEPRGERASSGASGGASGGAAAHADDDHDSDVSPALSAREARAGAEAAPPSADDGAPPSASAAEDAGAEAAADAQPGRLREVGEKAAMAGKAVAGKIAPALAGAGARAATAMAGLVARIKARRAARAGDGDGSGKDGGPRRKTAPPPAGALKSGGRRLVREEPEEAAGEGGEPPRFNKKAAAVGSFLGLAAVLVVFGAARFLGLRGGDAPSAGAESAAGAPALPASASSGAPALAAAAGPAAAPGGALTANVPLFGATPLSTTEPVPPTPPAEPSALAGDALAPGAAVPGGPGEDDEVEAADDGDQEGPREWGQGSVRNPIVLKLKMDGPIEELNGAAGAMGFTVSLPDRRALSSGSGLARKDKRIASVRVVNTAHGAEVTLQFKDGVPAYKAKARGDRLEIALGRGESKKVASKSKPEKNEKHDKKKGDDAKKKSEKGSGKKDKER
ncbi:PilZ domain-containing protein [Sorangium sp. So ce117]|uniref:PilZ domain-containing protein n=1 Tax=Sorangium sp. So ce117 TaxID=3133277 RepID=UPI003F5DD7B2